MVGWETKSPWRRFERGVEGNGSAETDPDRDCWTLFPGRRLSNRRLRNLMLLGSTPQSVSESLEQGPRFSLSSGIPDMVWGFAVLGYGRI